MEKVVHKFASHLEADEFDRQYYASLTPAERIEILLHLLEDTLGTEPRLERGQTNDLIDAEAVQNAKPPGSP